VDDGADQEAIDVFIDMAIALGQVSRPIFSRATATRFGSTASKRSLAGT
jgi:hypothetical protein